MFGDATRLDLPASVARLLAFLALHAGTARRSVVAVRLFPEVSDPRAQASLRSALRRLDGPARDAVEVAPLEVGLARSVSVDLHAVTEKGYVAVLAGFAIDLANPPPAGQAVAGRCRRRSSSTTPR